MTELEKSTFKRSIKAIKDVLPEVSGRYLPAPTLFEKGNPYKDSTKEQIDTIAKEYWGKTYAIRQEIEDSVRSLEMVYDSLESKNK